MSYTRLVVPVALGLSLATVTAFVVYYIFKQDDDETNERSVKTSKVNTIEISVPKSIVPALIGRGGSNAKDIEKKTGALIHFKKFSDKDYDVCIIRGRSDATQLAETLVHEFIKNQPLIVEDTLSVPAWACGRIIGTGGENVTVISHRSGARIKIENGITADNVRQVTFKGTAEQIEVAKGLIQNCVAQEKCRREIEQAKRSPRHAQPVPSPTPSNRSTDDTTDANEMPEVAGAPIEVYVSAVSSPSRFWVQFVGQQVTQLDELVQIMSDYYGNKDNRESHALRQVSVGQVVAAVFRHDGRWYRARVADIRPNEFDATQQVADCFFVDYGDSEYVSTHELCELRGDFLRLRFQAMECFLAGVRPAGKEQDVVAHTENGHKWDKWHSQAVERFEELTQVARWKPLVSKTCTYKKTMTADGEKEREIPGIKLYDVNDEGELDIGAVLVAEGWAVIAPSTRNSPARAAPPTPATPFGDLGNSRVLGMLGERGERSASLPKDHERAHSPSKHDPANDDPKMPTSKSLGSGLEHSNVTKPSPNLQDISYPHTTIENNPRVNGSHEDFLKTERQHSEMSERTSPAHVREEFKANMNRIDSHHSNLGSYGRSQELHK